MAKFKIGDLVVLKSGSMRMCVEGTDEGADTVSTVWCNEGVIGRDAFPAVLLNKWEYRDENRSGSRDAGRDGRPARGGYGKGGYDKGGPGRGGHGSDKGDGDRSREKPRKQGWDGKPRDKKYFRSED